MERSEMVSLFQEWACKVDSSTLNGDGEAMCESTRMALAFALILHAYFPDDLPPETARGLADSFSKALERVSRELEEGQNPDGCYDLYRENVRERLQKLLELINHWWGTPISPNKAHGVTLQP